MKRLLIVLEIVACILGLSAVLSAQTLATDRDRLGWDQPAKTLAEAQSYVYLVSIDGAAPFALTATCADSATGLYPCEAPFPASTPGPHSLVVITRSVADPSHPLDADPSVPLAYTLEFVPGTPVNVRRLPPASSSR